MTFSSVVALTSTLMSGGGSCHFTRLSYLNRLQMHTVFYRDFTTVSSFVGGDFFTL